MRMIVNGFDDPIHIPVISAILKKFNVVSCYLICSTHEIKMKISTKMSLLNAASLSLGNYNVNWNKLKPLDEELIESMSSCETVVLRMMDRHMQIMSYDERKRLYLKHLRYWNHVLDKNKIDLFLSSAPPHEVYDYIIYSLCKLRKIPTISLFQIMDSDVVIVMDDWQNINPDIEKKYQNLLDTLKSVPKGKIELKGGLKTDFEYQLSQKNTTPHYLLLRHPPGLSLFLKKSFHIIGRAMSLVSRPLVLLDKIMFLVNLNLTKKYASILYEKNTSKPNFKSRYIYFPLHMQPEATTSPLAGAFVDQILIAQMITYFLPKNVYLYIKEHPSQAEMGRDPEFYNELLKIPQVRLMPISTNTFDLIRNSIAVATATGTAGWEALYRRKPVLLFGHCYYQYAKGVFRIKTNNDCKYAIIKIIKGGYKPKIKDIKIYLKALEDYTIEGYIDPAYKNVSKITDEISNQNLVDKLSNKINSIYELR